MFLKILSAIVFSDTFFKSIFTKNLLQMKQEFIAIDKFWDVQMKQINHKKEEL